MKNEAKKWMNKLSSCVRLFVCRCRTEPRPIWLINNNLIGYRYFKTYVCGGGDNDDDDDYHYQILAYLFLVFATSLSHSLDLSISGVRAGVCVCVCVTISQRGICTNTQTRSCTNSHRLFWPLRWNSMRALTTTHTRSKCQTIVKNTICWSVEKKIS